MRSAITARTASAATRLARRKASMTSAIVPLHLGDQRLQALDVLRRQRPVLGVVGHQGGHLAAEQAVQEALTFAGDVVRAADEGSVLGAAGDPLGRDGLL